MALSNSGLPGLASKYWVKWLRVASPVAVFA
jgi:hypothetical protein